MQWVPEPWASSGVASFFRFTDDRSQRKSPGKSHLITKVSLVGPRAVLLSGCTLQSLNYKKRPLLCYNAELEGKQDAMFEFRECEGFGGDNWKDGVGNMCR